MLYKLGDVAKEISVRVNDPAHSGYDRFVGLEHYEPGEVRIHNYGSTEMLGSAMKEFKAGDILVARRNVYLRRASVVDFDGITSGDSIVLRIEDPTISKLMPFVLNTDDFWEFADRYSDGTMSKRLSPKTLKEYEFELPDNRLEWMADTLWAAYETKEKYVNLIKMTDGLVKSQFIEMFGDPLKNPKGWKKATFDEIADLITDGEHATPRRVDHGIYLLSARNVLDHELSFETVDYIDQEEYDRISKRLIPRAGDVLISCSGTVGRVCVVPEDLKFQMVRSVALVRFKDGINPVFMERQISMPYIQDQIDASKSKTSQANLFQGKIKKLEAIVPPTELQDEFLNFVEQSDKSKYTLGGQLCLMKMLLNK